MLRSVRKDLVTLTNIKDDKNLLQCSVKLCFGRYIKNYFGRGPEKIAVALGKRQITVELYGLLYEGERKVVGIDKVERAIKKHRGLLLETLCSKVDPIERWLGFPVKEVKFDFLPEEDKCSVILDLSEDVQHFL
ncbi:MAG: hypothetical protein CVU89_09635 [Firmicutes bacterium HGW-Firmicutes-14]|nr:MAG: hypothetical protein CVU89_09635 [Firmicutes bacterium HGW-Firmicutes-14]